MRDFTRSVGRAPNDFTRESQAKRHMTRVELPVTLGESSGFATTAWPSLKVPTYLPMVSKVGSNGCKSPHAPLPTR